MQCFMLMRLERVTNGKIRVEHVVGIFDEFVYMEVVVQCESGANHRALGELQTIAGRKVENLVEFSNFVAGKPMLYLL